MKVQFSVAGEPQGKGRPRFSTFGGKVSTRTPDATVLYENQIKAEYMSKCRVKFPDDAMLDVRVMAFYTIPKSVSKKKRQAMIDHKIRPTKKPDFDNIGKVVCDSLNGIAYRDDAQIVDAQVRKFYSETPRVVISISDIPSEY